MKTFYLMLLLVIGCTTRVEEETPDPHPMQQKNYDDILFRYSDSIRSAKNALTGKEFYDKYAAATKQYWRDTSHFTSWVATLSSLKPEDTLAFFTLTDVISLTDFVGVATKGSSVYDSLKNIAEEQDVIVTGRSISPPVISEYTDSRLPHLFMNVIVTDIHPLATTSAQ